ncbi:hypothetical protein [Mycolicibacterium phlei]|jgi:hypothetical protein
MSTAVRMSRFVVDRYPPVLAAGYAVASGVGGVGLFAALAGERIPLSAAPMLGIVAVTLFADLLILRVLDDIRDSEYDRIANPQRALAAGAVAPRDLSTLCALCVTVIVVVNLTFPQGLMILVAQLLYAAALVATVSGDNLVVNLLAGIPVQLLLYAYLLAAFADIRAGGATAAVGGLGVLILTLLAGMVEFGKKLVRRPEPGERSYVNSIGYQATSLLTFGTGPLAAALFAIAAPVSPFAKALVALPSVGVTAFGIRYLANNDNRWPAAVSTLGLLGTLVAFAVVGVIG